MKKLYKLSFLLLMLIGFASVSFAFIPPTDVVDAGDDATICKDASFYTLDNADVQGYDAITWTTSGTGTWSNTDHLLRATYYPSAGDKANVDGYVTLTVSANKVGSATPTTDFMNLYFADAPTANAGTNKTICETESYTTSDASASNYTAVTWTTLGDGSLTNYNSVTQCAYVPGTTDKSTGWFALTLEAGNAYCESVSSTVTLSIVKYPVADAGDDDTICEDNVPYQLDASLENYSSISWTNGRGDGTFSSQSVINPTYSPGLNDIEHGRVTLTVILGNNSPCGTPKYSGINEDDMVLTIIKNPVADAGDDDTICEDNVPYQLDAELENYESISWTTSGTGTFSNGLIEDPTYNPSVADVDGGSVTLTVTLGYNTPCGPEKGTISNTDDLTLSFVKNPTANAGSDATICEDNVPYQLDAELDNYESISWTTSGTGTFSNGLIEDPSYNPSSDDINNGSVTLTVTLGYNSPCGFDKGATVNTDDMVLTIIKNPVADAGEDDTVCEDNVPYALDATLENYESISWTTSGSGTFSNGLIEKPTYNPSVADINNGSVTLTATLEYKSPCGITPPKGISTNTDDMVLTIVKNPVADAGEDDTVCEDNVPYALDATLENYESISWTTNGSGTFSNDTTNNPSYNPSTADINNGSVTLTVTLGYNSPCRAPKYTSATNTDNMVLTIIKNPVADAGDDDTVCEDNVPYALDATLENYESISWTTSGTGTFSNGLIEDPSYNPSSDDINNGSVTLTVTLGYNSPCGSVKIESGISDDMTLTFVKAPTANAGSNGTTCEGVSYTLSGTAGNYTSVSWTSTGNGVFDDENKLAAKYTAADGDNPSVTLTLTAYGNTPCSTPATSMFTLTVGNAPDVDAGIDASICESGYTLNGDVQNGGSTLWTTFGDGTFNNASILAPFYTPGSDDKTAGSVKLSLVSTANLPCTALYSDDIYLYITQDLPTVFAGADATSCEDDPYTISDATATNHSALIWINLDADGTYDDHTAPNPVYTFGDDDISQGFAKLKLVASPKSPCVLLVEDQITIYVQDEPAISAGNDATVCEDGVYHLTGASGSNYASVGWYTTLGTGTFDNENKLYAKYTMSDADVLYGSVTLCIIATPNSPCTPSIEDCMTLTIQLKPVADAGADNTICQNDSYTLSDATAENYSSVTWSGGVGEFDYPNKSNPDLNPSYTPAQSEYGTTVTLTLTAEPIGPCTTSDDDSMDLYIQELPTADAGDDDTVCEDGSFTVDDATAENYSSVTWVAYQCLLKSAPEGDGTFQNVNTLTPTYTPGTQDIANGFICLTLVAEPKSPCTTSDEDQMELKIQHNAVVNAGIDATICGNDSYTLADATAENYSSVTWSGGAGDFSYPDKSNPAISATYTPDESEYGTTVTLTLTAQAIDPCTAGVDDTMDLNILEAPEANAGSGASICEDGSYTVDDATADNYDAVTWTSNGAGTIDNVATLTPTYNAGSGETGTITLILHAEPVSPCTTEDTDDMEIIIQAKPIADAGNDGTICADGSFTVSGSSVDNADSYQWSAGACLVKIDFGGDGSWENETTLSPIYTPGDEDIANGSVCLTIEALPETHCSVSDYSTIEVLINALPEVTAVDLQIAVADPSPSYNSAAGDLDEGYQVCLDGILGNQYNLDINTLTSTPGLELDVFNEFFHDTENLPDGFDTWWDESYGVNATATGWQAVMWDIINGEAPLFYLVARAGGQYELLDGLKYQFATQETALLLDGNYPQGDYSFMGTVKDVNGCVSEETSIGLTVVHAPTANAGGDATIASNQTYTLSDAEATNYSSVSWGTSGDGEFDDDTELNPSYTPGSNDAGTNVTLTLYVDPLAPCADQVTDAMILTVKAAPVVLITSPADKEIMYSVNDTVVGTASDADGTVTKVEVNINDGGWLDATGTGTWDYIATYNHGLNTILARATDDDGYVSDYDTARVYVHLHTIALKPGYQMISTYLDPINPDIVGIMSPVVADLNEMITLPNKIYLPSFGINTILNWNVMTAYKLRMAQAGEITIAGDPLKDNTLDLDGFAYLPVLSDQPSPIATIFNDPMNDVVVIVELGNPFGIYFPDGGLLLLETLEPGKGYQARFNKPVTVTYPEYLGYNATDYVPQTIESESPWTIAKTGDVHVISIQKDAMTELTGMDYIGAFDTEGNCIGYADLGISSGNLPMMLFGNDTYTEVKDGAAEGETINFVAYNAAIGEETPLIAEFDQNMPEHNGTFATNGVSIINSLYKGATGVADGEFESSIKIFPNPAKDILNIQIMGTEKVESVSIHAANGVLIQDLPAFEGNIQTDVSNLQKGVYFIQIEFSGSTIVRRIVIL